ncbi:MAG: hypothetical protein H5T44_01175 [Thermoplasmatales archaeon]|nr:hypothetical protein [Thermoplasmatales archaeon]
MDNVSITIVAILLFLFAWFGVMIITTKPKEEEKEERVEKVEKVEKAGEKNEIEIYKKRIEELEGKIKKIEEERPANEKLLSWLTELYRENEILRMRLSQVGNPTGDLMKYENEKLLQELESHKKKIGELENEIRELKNSINYYRDLVSKLQGSYTVLNKYNYRVCIRDIETGEYKYELVKLPHDFDPFNPSYITGDGIEVYEEYGIRIPTKLGDIIREEFKKDIFNEIEFK